MISNLSATSKIKVSNLDLDKNDTYFKLEDLEITPSEVEQKFKSKKYGYDNVTVKAVESEELNIIPSTETQINKGMFNKVTVAGDNNLMPENIVKGATIFGVEGITNATNAKITDASYLFYKGAKIDNLYELLRLCENITNTQYMFSECKALTELDLSSFDTSKVTNMSNIFNDCSNLVNIDLSNFDTSNVTNMGYMFYGCKVLTNIDTSKFDTSNVTDMQYMFYECRALTELDLSNFDTSNVTKMNRMFSYCLKLTNIDTSKFDTSNVTDMTYMFSMCGAETLNLNHFDTSKVTSMQSMFTNSSKLKNIIINNFNTSNVTNMSAMFSTLSKLEYIDLSSFDMSKITNIYNMFGNCANIKTIISFKNLGKGYTQKSNNYSDYILNVSYHKSLTHESLVDVITNGLYDLNLTYNVANGGTLYTQKLQLGSTNMAKLTADEIAIATNKGWTVS